VNTGSAAQKTVRYLTVPIPHPGTLPSRFRREFIFSIKRSILEAFRSGSLDAAIAEECWRALPSFLGRP
jgi:hypothetical protein